MHESDGSVTIEVFFVHGIPGDYQPVVQLSTHNGTATGQYVLNEQSKIIFDKSFLEGRDFSALTSSQITFSAVNRVQRLAIPIIYTNSTEISEEFTVTLDEVILINTINRTTVNLSEEESARLILNPRIASITILDDNGTL